MKNFTWWNPTIVLFGRGTVLQLADQLEAAGVESVLLLYGGKAIFKNGVYTQVADALTKKGIAFPELGGVRPARLHILRPYNLRFEIYVPHLHSYRD